MKTLCTTFAFLSVMGFTMLVSSAIFDRLYMHSFTKVELPIPHSGETVAVDNASINCLAQNIYYEAQGESDRGKLLVGMVVMERVESPHFPHTVCGVVYQSNKDDSGNSIKHECAFSWVCDGRNHAVNFDNVIDRREWVASYTIAKAIIDGTLKSSIDMTGVTHYHASYVRPYWSRNKNYKRVVKVGDHIFYRWTKAMIPSNVVASR